MWRNTLCSKAWCASWFPSHHKLHAMGAKHKFVAPQICKRQNPRTRSVVCANGGRQLEAPACGRKRMAEHAVPLHNVGPHKAHSRQQSIRMFMSPPTTPMQADKGFSLRQHTLRICGNEPPPEPRSASQSADADGQMVAAIGSPDEYVQKLVAAVTAGQHDLGGTPWVRRPDPRREALRINDARKQAGVAPITSLELWHLTSRPPVFVWAPTILFPAVGVMCPRCGCTPKERIDAHRTRGHHSWARPRAIQGLAWHAVCVATDHRCNNCQPPRSTRRCGWLAPPARRPAQPRGTTFSAGTPGALALLPANARAQWCFVDSGRMLCEHTLLDLIRSLATAASWLSIASTINEMRETAWARNVVLPYHRLCASIGLDPIDLTVAGTHPPCIRAEWVRDIFVADFQARQPAVIKELSEEPCGDVISIDWTEIVAKRCGARYVFNVFDDNRKVMASVTTGTTSPHEVEQLLHGLKQRGAWPAAAYVDNGCCGVWAVILSRVWPGITVRLDMLHALKRITRTTISPKHPWHGKFCAMMSNTIYRYDESETRRLVDARTRAGLGEHLPAAVKAKHVPRVVAAPHFMCSCIEKVLGAFANARHVVWGELLTPNTGRAWACLRPHVLAGCLCDPPGIEMNGFDDHDDILIADEPFHIIHSRRGTSPLEGFHHHQQKWLGLGMHAADAASALMSDGSLRWNRRRSTGTKNSVASMPMVFAGDVVRDLRRCMNTGHRHHEPGKLSLQHDPRAAPIQIMPAQKTSNASRCKQHTFNSGLPDHIKCLALDMQNNTAPARVPHHMHLLKRRKCTNGDAIHPASHAVNTSPKCGRQDQTCTCSPACDVCCNVVDHALHTGSVVAMAPRTGGTGESLLKRRKAKCDLKDNSEWQ